MREEEKNNDKNSEIHKKQISINKEEKINLKKTTSLTLLSYSQIEKTQKRNKSLPLILPSFENMNFKKPPEEENEDKKEEKENKFNENKNEKISKDKPQNKTKQKNKLINILFQQKKQFNQRIKHTSNYMETENSPEKKYYHNKQIEQIWKDIDKQKTEHEENKKKQNEEKKFKLKKYEKMKIRKKQNEDVLKSNEKNEIVQKASENNDILLTEKEELVEKIEYVKHQLSKILSSISIKTFLVF